LRSARQGKHKRIIGAFSYHEAAVALDARAGRGVQFFQHRLRQADAHYTACGSPWLRAQASGRQIAVLRDEAKRRCPAW
jgi:hypothetical protein